MSWTSSTRRQRLPQNWSTIRTRVWRRDRGRCQWPTDTGICSAPGRDVDHIADPEDHADANLRVLCGPHHDAKTQREAAAAKPRLNRSAEQHPGLIG